MSYRNPNAWNSRGQEHRLDGGGRDGCPCDDTGTDAEIPQDLISDLPTNVLHGILEFLPLRTAARTSLLSQKWRDIWPTLPCLVFDARFFRAVLKLHNTYYNKGYDNLEFISIVSKILFEHRGPIHKFTLTIPRRLKEKPDISQWVSFLSRNGIKELTLQNWYKSALTLPLCLFSCGDLEKLKLNFGIFHLPHSYKGFRNLRCLEFENIAFEGDVFARVIAGCPLLEKLKLRKWSGFDKLNISAQNLKYLTISGTFRSICFSACQNLSSVSISLKEMVNNCDNNGKQKLIKFLTSSCDVEMLCFGGYFVKFLAAGDLAALLPVPFNHVKVLDLSSMGSDVELSCVIGFIQSCPNVEELNISVTAEADVSSGCEVSSEFLRLHTINATLNKGSDLEFKLIENLVACSPALENIFLRVNENVDTHAKSRVSRKLKQLHKASPKIFSTIYATGDDYSSEWESDNADSDDYGSDSDD